MAYIGAGITRFNTADELTVTGDAQIDGNTLVIDSTNNRVGIGTSSPDHDLTLQANTNPIFEMVQVAGGPYKHQIAVGGNDLQLRASSGALIMYTGNADGASSTERMRLDSSGRVMIGTTTEGDASADDLTVAGSANTGITIRAGTSNSSSIYMSDATSGAGEYAGFIAYGHNTNSMSFGTSSGTRMTIDSSGNVGIGSSSPTKPLTVVGSDFSTVLLDTANASHGTQILFQANGAANSGADIQMSDAGGLKIRTLAVEPLSFHTAASAGTSTERMRIDSSGNVLVGVSSVQTQGGTTAGTSFYGGSNAGLITAGRNGDVLRLNRHSTDGDIAVFRKNGTTVGSIGTIGGDMVAGTGDTGLRFHDGVDQVYPSNTNGSGRDAAIDLGNSGARFKDLYLSGGAYLGGTGSTNHLDDYEEGTWTPTIGGTATYYSRAGYYIKIGKLVFITGIVHVNAVGTGATNKFEGLPFGGATGTGREAFIGVQYFNNLNVSATYFALRVNSTQLYGSMQGGADGAMSINPIFTTASTEVAFAGCYHTN